MAAGTANAVGFPHMNRSSLVAALAGALLFGSVASAQADDEPTRELLPFSRQIAVSGTVAESLEASIAEAGVPVPAVLDALEALKIKPSVKMPIHCAGNKVQ